MYLISKRLKFSVMRAVYIFRTPAAVEQSSNSTSVSKDDNVYENYTMPHPIWSQKEVHSVRVTHKTPQGINDWVDRIILSTSVVNPENIFIII